jgi:thiol:disulfide interchange protein
MKRNATFLLASAGIILVSQTISLAETRDKDGKPSDLISFQASFVNDSNPGGEKIKARRGEIVRLRITGTPKAGYRTYPVTKALANQSISGLTILKYAELKGVVPLWPIQETEPKPGFENGEPIGLEHDNTFSLEQDFFINADARPGIIEVPIQLRSQVCDIKYCHFVNTEIKVAVEISADDALPMSEQLKARLDVKKPETIIEPTPASVKPEKAIEAPKATPKTANVIPSSLISVSAEQYKASMESIAARLVHKDQEMSMDLLGFILAGIFWGAVSLITPCVFPMIPITVSFFLKQSEKEHHRPVTMALVYSATIVIVLTLAAAMLLQTFKWLSVNPIMNYGLGALFVFFALSLFGMYDIELPSGLARFTSSKEGKGGMVGTIFMALTFTIISFACVAPFLGGFGGTSATSARPWWHNILGGLAFAVTFASPFFFLALFPTLLRKMPKSGSWLNSVKVVMGFLELAAALKFFRAAELVQSATPTFFTFDLVLGIWIALCLLCGLYLLGMYRLPHDTPEEHIRVPGLIFAILFLGLGLYLAPALFKINAEGDTGRPSGALYAWVDSFLLPDIKASKEGNTTGNLEYAVAQAQETSKRTGKPKRIFLDFTGINCINCKINERAVFSKPEIQALFKDYLVAQIYTDTLPADLYAPALRAQFGNNTARQIQDADVNSAFQQKAVDTLQLPTYAVLEPKADGKIAILGIYPEGRINDITAFAEFLRDPK